MSRGRVNRCRIEVSGTRMARARSRLFFLGELMVKRFREEGVTIVEVMVVAVIATVSFVGMVSVFVQSQRSN